VFPIAVSPDGMYLAAQKRNSLQVWDTATGKRLHVLNAAQKPANNGAKPTAPDGLGNDFGLTFSSDSKRLLVAAASGVLAWDMATGKSASPPGQHANLQELGSDSVAAP